MEIELKIWVFTGREIKKSIESHICKEKLCGSLGYWQKPVSYYCCCSLVLINGYLVLCETHWYGK